MPRPRTLFLALLVTLLWGSSFVLTKIALTELGPLSIAFYRWLIAGAAFALVLPAQKALPVAWAALRQDLGHFALLGAVGISAFYALQNLALRLTTAVNVGLLINFTTIFIAVLGVLWLRERLQPSAFAGIIVSFAGAVLVSMPDGGLRLEDGYLLGDALTLLAGLSAAIYTIHGKQLVARYSPTVVTALAIGFGAAFLLPLAAWEGMAIPRTWQVYATLLTLGLGSGALANLWWWHILKRVDAARAGTFLLVVPVVSTLLAVFALKETMPGLAPLGALLVLVGVYLTQRDGRK